MNRRRGTRVAEYTGVTNAANAPGRIAAMFMRDDSLRIGTLDDARENARLTIPSALPPQEWTEAERLPRNWQSLGGRGVNNLVGKTLLGTFSPDRPWINQSVAPAILYNPAIDPAKIQSAQQQLFLQTLQIIATLESADYSEDQGNLLGFLTTMRQACAQVFITGDTLVRMDSKFRCMVFRRDRYVTKRSDEGAVCYHVTCESKDPLELSDEQLARCELKYDELREQEPHERYQNLYTLIEYQPRGRNWVITQEFGGHELNAEPSEEPITNHFSIPFDLPPGGNYGRALSAITNGDLASFDNLSWQTLNFAAAAAKHHPVMDPNSELQPNDLMQNPGQVLVDKVEGGIPKNIAMLQCGSLNDFKVVQLTKDQLRQDLGKAFLLSEAVRDSERTTAFEVESVTLAELQGALGAFYAPFADRIQLPLFLRTRHQLRLQNRLPTLPDEAIKTQVVSGITALARQSRATRIMGFAEVVQKLDPNGEYLNVDVLLDVLARMQGIAEPGIVRTPQEREKIRQQALRTQAQAQAQEQIIKSAGAIAEQSAAGASNAAAA